MALRLALQPLWLQGIEGAGLVAGTSAGAGAGTAPGAGVGAALPRIFLRATFESTTLDGAAGQVVAARRGVSWAGSPALVWEVARSAWTRLMAVRPLLRLNVVVAASSSGTPETVIGYCLLNLAAQGLPRLVPAPTATSGEPLRVAVTDRVTVHAKRRPTSASRLRLEVSPDADLELRLTLEHVDEALAPGVTDRAHETALEGALDASGSWDDDGGGGDEGAGSPLMTVGTSSGSASGLGWPTMASSSSRGVSGVGSVTLGVAAGAMPASSTVAAAIDGGDDGDDGDEPDLDAIPIGVGPGEGQLSTLTLILHWLAVAEGAAARPLTPAQCWLSYKVFGVLLQSSMFQWPPLAGAGAGGHSARVPIAMTDVFTLRSTPDRLRAFLAATPPLPVYLATHGTLVATTHVPLHRLAELPAAMSDPAVAASISPQCAVQEVFALRGGDGHVAGHILASVAISPLQPTPPSTTALPQAIPRVSDDEDGSDAVGDDRSAAAHAAAHSASPSQLPPPPIMGEPSPPPLAGLLKMTPVIVRLSRIEVNGGEAGPTGAAPFAVTIRYAGTVPPSLLPTTPDGPATARQLVQQHDVVMRVATGDDVAAEADRGATAPAVAAVLLPAAAAPLPLLIHLPTDIVRGAGSTAEPLSPFGALVVEVTERHDATPPSPAAHDVAAEGASPTPATTATAPASPIPRRWRAVLPAAVVYAAAMGDPMRGAQFMAPLAADSATGTTAGMVHLKVQLASPPPQPPSPAPATAPAPTVAAAAVPPAPAPQLRAQPSPAAPLLTAAWPTASDASHTHTWRLTIDVRALAAAGTTHDLPQALSAQTATVVARYAYDGVARMLAALQRGGRGRVATPFTSSLTTVTSTPPITISPASERILPNAAVSMSFAASPAALFSALRDAPLLVDIVSMPTGTRLGSAVIPIVHVTTPGFSTSPPFTAVAAGSLTGREREAVSTALAYRHRVSGDAFSSSHAYSTHCTKLAVSGGVPASMAYQKPALVATMQARVAVLRDPAGGDTAPSTTGYAIHAVVYLEDGGRTSQSPPPPSQPAAAGAGLRSTNADDGLASEGAAVSDEEGDDDGGAGDSDGDGSGEGDGGGENDGEGALGMQVGEGDPARLRVTLDPLVIALVAREEAALSAWRAEAERDWTAAKAAAEEQWRRESETAYGARVTALEAAWAERETERQAAVMAAQESVAKVEARLRKLLVSAEAKERELDRLREEARAAAEAKTAEMNALARRLREDAEHSIAMAKQREAASAQRAAEGAREAALVRDKYEALRTTHEALLLKQATGPDAALRDTLISLQSENSAMQTAVTAAKAEAADERAAKEEARLQVLRLAREVAKLREAARLREAAESHRLRVAYVAAEERFTLQGERAALREIRRQVEAVRDSGAATGDDGASASRVRDVPAGVATGAAIPDVGRIPMPDGTSPLPSEAASSSGSSGSVGGGAVERLKAERALLVVTAPHVYTASHPAVAAIDRKLALLRRAPIASPAGSASAASAGGM